MDSPIVYKAVSSIIKCDFSKLHGNRNLLNEAIMKNKPEIYNMILSSSKYDAQSAFETALEAGNVELVDRLLNCNDGVFFSVNAKKSIIKSRSEELLKYLIKHNYARIELSESCKYNKVLFFWETGSVIDFAREAQWNSVVFFIDDLFLMGAESFIDDLVKIPFTQNMLECSCFSRDMKLIERVKSNHKLNGDSLLLAILSGDAEVVRFVLDDGVDPNTLFDYNTSALMLAASLNSFEVLYEVVSTDGIDINARNSLFLTALDYSLKSTNPDIPKFIVSLGLTLSNDWNIRSFLNTTVDPKIMRWILHECSLEKNSELLLCVMSSDDYSLVAEFLNEYELNYNDFDRIVRFHTSGKDESLRALFDVKGASHSFIPKLFLQLVVNDIYEPLEAILEHDIIDVNGLDQSWNGNTYLHIASQMNSVNVFKYLFHRDDVNPFKLNNDDETILHSAVEYNSYFIIQMIIEDGRVNPNSQDSFGNTPLHIAARRLDSRSISILMSSPAINPNILNNDLIAPVHELALRNDYDCIHMMVSDCRTNIGIKNYNQETVFAIARRYSGARTMRALEER